MYISVLYVDDYNYISKNASRSRVCNGTLFMYLHIRAYARVFVCISARTHFLHIRG